MNLKEPRLREIDQRGFRRRLMPILDVYAAAMDPPPDQLPGRWSIMERHVGHPGFRAIVAEQRRPLPGLPALRGGLAGFVYGFRGVPGQWWHDVVRQALADRAGAAEAERWLGSAFEVAELHVRPDFQGRGLGRALLGTVCRGRPERTMVLSTMDRPDSPARRLYRSMGLHDLLTDFAFPGGGPRYAVMGAALPLAAYEAASSSP